MTRDELIELAKEAGWPDSLVAPVIMAKLKEFAVLVEKRKCNDLAKQIEAMPFGDTAASFAVWIREQA